MIDGKGHGGRGLDISRISPHGNWLGLEIDPQVNGCGPQFFGGPLMYANSNPLSGMFAILQ